MLKESAIDKLIEYIRALPENDQITIAQKINGASKSLSRPAKASDGKKMKPFFDYCARLPTRLPKNYKFDRELANGR